MLFIPKMNDRKKATFTLSCPASGSPAETLRRVGWLRRPDLDSRIGTAYQSPTGAILRFGNVEDVWQYINDRKLGYAMRAVRVTYWIETAKDPDQVGQLRTFATSINGTDEAIIDYYYNMPVHLNGEDDPRGVAVLVSFPIAPGFEHYRAAVQPPKRLEVDVLPFVNGGYRDHLRVIRQCNPRFQRSITVDDRPVNERYYMTMSNGPLIALDRMLSEYGPLFAKDAGDYGRDLHEFPAWLEGLVHHDARDLPDHPAILKAAEDIRNGLLEEYDRAVTGMSVNIWEAQQ